jgi:hypothetical protein
VDFDLSQDQQEIKAVARELLTARSPWAKVREAAETKAYDDALWRELAELGWPGIAVGEAHGGQGLGAVALAVILEELGYACAASPLFSAATAAAVIDACGTDEQRSRYLPALAAGEATAGVGTRELCATAPARPCSSCSTATTPSWWTAPTPTSRRSTRSTPRAASPPCGTGTGSRWRPAPPTACARPSPPRSSASASVRST